MSGPSGRKIVRLIVTDVDNTLFDWVGYYVSAFGSLLERLSSIIGVPYGVLAAESREVFSRHGSIEYPFLVQELPSVLNHYKEDVDLMLAEAVMPARDTFKDAAGPWLRPYSGVNDTLRTLKARLPGVPLVALTDAPRYVAMWKMNKLGLLPYFDAVYGLADPRLPTDPLLGRVKVDPGILLKHLQQNNFDYQGRIRILPDEYEKPGTRGLKTVLMDYDMDEDPAHRGLVLWIGDNVRKDMQLGHRLGVINAWASYGAQVAPEMMRRLAEFSPPQNVHKNANLTTLGKNDHPPDIVLGGFDELLNHIEPG